MLKKKIIKSLISTIGLLLSLIIFLTPLIALSNNKKFANGEQYAITGSSTLLQSGSKELTHSFSIDNITNETIMAKESIIEFKFPAENTFKVLRRKPLPLNANSVIHTFDTDLSPNYDYRAVIRIEYNVPGTNDKQTTEFPSPIIKITNAPTIKMVYITPRYRFGDIKISVRLLNKSEIFQLSYQKATRDLGSSNEASFGPSVDFTQSTTEATAGSLTLNKEYKFRISGTYRRGTLDVPMSEYIDSEWLPLTNNTPEIENAKISQEATTKGLKLDMNMVIKDKDLIEKVTFKLFEGTTINNVDTFKRDYDITMPANTPPNKLWTQTIAPTDSVLTPFRFYRFEVFVRFKVSTTSTTTSVLESSSNTIKFKRPTTPNLSVYTLGYSTPPTQDIEVNNLKITYDLSDFSNTLNDELHVELFKNTNAGNVPPDPNDDSIWVSAKPSENITNKANNNGIFTHDFNNLPRELWYRARTTIKFKNAEGNDAEAPFTSDKVYVGKSIPNADKNYVDISTTQREPHIKLDVKYNDLSTNDPDSAITRIHYQLYKATSADGTGQEETPIEDTGTDRSNQYLGTLEDTNGLIDANNWYAIRVTIHYDLGDTQTRTLTPFFTDWVQTQPKVEKQKLKREGDASDEQVEINNLEIVYNLSSFSKNLNDKLYLRLDWHPNSGDNEPSPDDSGWDTSATEVEVPHSTITNAEFTKKLPENLTRRRWYRVTSFLRFNDNGAPATIESKSNMLYVGKIKPNMTKGQFIVTTTHLNPHIKFNVKYSEPPTNDPNGTITRVDYQLHSSSNSDGSGSQPVEGLSGYSVNRGEGYELKLEDTGNKINKNEWYAVQIIVTYDLDQKKLIRTAPFFTNWVKKFPELSKQELSYAQDPSEDVEVNNLQMTYNLSNFGIEDTDKLFVQLYSNDAPGNTPPSTDPSQWKAFGNEIDITDKAINDKDFHIQFENVDRKKWYKAKTTIRFKNNNVNESITSFSTNIKYVGKSIPKSNKDLYTIKQIKDSGTERISVKYNEPNNNDPENAIKKIHYKLYSANNQAGDGSKPTKLEGESEVRDGGYAVVLDEKNEDIIQNDKWYAIEVTITYDLGDAINRTKTEFLGWSKIAVTKNNAASYWWIWIIIIFGILIIHGVSWYIYRKVRYEPFVDPDQNPIGTYGQNTN